MAKIATILMLLIVLVCLITCNKANQSKSNDESILKGSATIFVDETVAPLMDDQIAVFESKYDAKIKMVSQSEDELIQLLLKEPSGIAILTRDLTATENKIFNQKKINPKTTKFATDAIVLIAAKSISDTLIDLETVLNYLRGKPTKTIKGMVFDNPNSSTVRYFKQLAGITKFPSSEIYSFKTNEEVIKFVSENNGVIGVVGLNWLTQPMPIMDKYVNNIASLSVKSRYGNKFYSPSQNNIAEGKYPLARDLHIINAQGYSGLGMGFSSFIAGDIGQRIVLKSGLLPIQIPGRKIIIRNGIINEKK